MFSQYPDRDRLDPTHLNNHFQRCAISLSPLHRLQCAAETLNAFLAPRFVTTLTVLTTIVLVGIALPL